MENDCLLHCRQEPDVSGFLVKCERGVRAASSVICFHCIISHFTIICTPSFFFPGPSVKKFFAVFQEWISNLCCYYFFMHNL